MSDPLLNPYFSTVEPGATARLRGHLTPIKPGLSSTNKFVFKPQIGRERGFALVDENGMGPRFHEVDIQTFLDFVPGEPPTPEECQLFQPPTYKSEIKLERRLYPIVTKTVNSVLKAGGGTLQALETAYHKANDGDNNATDTLNDIGIYPNTPEARGATDLTQDDRNKSKIDPSELQDRDLGRRSWKQLVALIEVKCEAPAAFTFPDQPKTLGGRSRKKHSKKRPVRGGVPGQPLASTSSHAPSTPLSTALPTSPKMMTSNETSSKAPDGRKPVVNNSDGGTGALAQLGEYVLNVFTHQHRLFLYGIYIKKKLARLVYFDRAGSLVSEAFSWETTDSPLHTFAWKLAHMTRAQLGYDPTVTPASKEDASMLTDMKHDDSVSSDEKAYVDAMTKDGSILYEVRVTSSPVSPEENFPDELAVETGELTEHRFLIGHPHYLAEAVIGRCTHGYIAFELGKTKSDKGRFCFLKDFWRSSKCRRTRPEHLFYKLLRARNVHNIPTLICGGDVDGYQAQKTRVQDYLPLEDRPVPRVHYRLVMLEIAVPLLAFRNFAELANVFAGAICGFHDAYCAGVLHSDISVGNIMINPVRRSALLVDWDLSRLVRELETGPTEPDPLGTWQYRSALSMMYPRKPYCLADDTESFVHCFYYCVLRYHETNVVGLRSYATALFECAAMVDGILLGGQLKMNLFDSSKAPFEAIQNEKLNKLLRTIAHNCHAHYALIDHCLMRDMYGVPHSPRIAAQPEQAKGLITTDKQIEDTHQELEMKLAIDGTGSPPLSPKHTHPSTQHPSDRPYDMNGILAAPLRLAQVFLKYAPDNVEDKAEDQFRVRANEESFRHRLVASSRPPQVSSAPTSYSVDGPPPHQSTSLTAPHSSSAVQPMLPPSVAAGSMPPPPPPLLSSTAGPSSARNLADVPVAGHPTTISSRIASGSKRRKRALAEDVHDAELDEEDGDAAGSSTGRRGSYLRKRVRTKK